MVLEFTKDKTCHYLDKQYMLGDSLLVAPIFNDESKAEYYLPQGIWTNFFTGKEYRGGAWIEVRFNAVCCHNNAMPLPSNGSRKFYGIVHTIHCSVDFYAIVNCIRVAKIRGNLSP